MVKDHGRAVFVEPSRVRSRRKHRFLKKQNPFQPFFLFKKRKQVTATSDMELQNVICFTLLWCIDKKKIMKTNTNDVGRIEQMLNDMGNQGWELASVIEAGEGYSAKFHSYFFKRPKL